MICLRPRFFRLQYYIARTIDPSSGIPDYELAWQSRWLLAGIIGRNYRLPVPRFIDLGAVARFELIANAESEDQFTVQGNACFSFKTIIT